MSIKLEVFESLSYFKTHLVDDFMPLDGCAIAFKSALVSYV